MDGGNVFVVEHQPADTRTEPDRLEQPGEVHEVTVPPL